MSQKKADVEKLIKANGGKIAGSVTSAVTYVVAADASTGKASQAQEKGEPALCLLRQSNPLHRFAAGEGVVSGRLYLRWYGRER